MGRVDVVTKAGWTRDNLRHGAAMLRYGRHPAATVYDSIGEEFFLALAPGWLADWPAVGVSFDDALAYVTWKNRVASLAPLGNRSPSMVMEPVAR